MGTTAAKKDTTKAAKTDNVKVKKGKTSVSSKKHDIFKALQEYFGFDKFKGTQE